MEGYQMTKEAAEKWEISQRQAQTHYHKKRISGVVMVETNYLIPSNAIFPIYGFYSVLQQQPEKDI